MSRLVGELVYGMNGSEMGVSVMEWEVSRWVSVWNEWQWDGS